MLVFDPYFYFNPSTIKFVKWKNITTKDSGLLLFPDSSLREKLAFKDLISGFIINFYNIEVWKKFMELYDLLVNSKCLALFSLMQEFSEIYNELLNQLHMGYDKYSNFYDFYKDKLKDSSLTVKFLTHCANYIKQVKSDKNVHFIDLFYITSPKYRKLDGFINDLKELVSGISNSYKRKPKTFLNQIIEDNELEHKNSFFVPIIKNIALKNYKYRTQHQFSSYELLLFMIRSAGEDSYLSNLDYKRLEQLAFLKYKYFISFKIKGVSQGSMGENLIIDYFANFINIFGLLSNENTVLKSATLFTNNNSNNRIDIILNPMIKAFDKYISLNVFNEIENLGYPALYLDYYLPEFDNFTVMITKRSSEFYNICVFSDNFEKIMNISNFLRSKNPEGYINEYGHIYSCELVSIHDACKDFNFQLDFPQ
jgi:hypothetical protein